MINPDEIDPPRTAPAKPADLTSLSIEELRAHIASLQAEIERAHTAIAAKKAQREGAEGLFSL